MNILEKICNLKKKNIESLKKTISVQELMHKKRKVQKKSFIDSFKKNKLNLIAEIKKKSPSAGLIRKDFNVIEIAKLYKKAGAECLSILTEKNFFGGNIHFMDTVKKATNLPILRKDFIIDEWQIYESYHHGADCILLIVAILEDKQIKNYLNIAKNLNLDVLVEVHNETETKRAIDLGVKCIGINNRNLKTLKIDLNCFEKLSKLIPKYTIKIAESGLTQNKQLLRLRESGADGFLVGEFLLKQKDIFLSTKELIKNDK
tara:strand:- start:1511 stop:2290 length:780 start_codon:yes stop_codon:yes gene_type:complete